MSFLKGVAKILGKIIQFIEKLFNRHGAVSTTSTIKRTQEILPKSHKPPEPDTETKPETETKIKPEPDTKTKHTPPPVIKAINIADKKSWEKFRETVLTLDVLTDFFQNRDDDQSPQFLNSIEQYRKSLEKNLATPEKFDGNSSAIFVDKLAYAIKKRFYPILRACKRGSNGKGSQSNDYYKEMEERINRYFESIGLISLDIKPLSNFKDYENLQPLSISTDDPDKKDLIAEIEIQPHYFAYYDEHGEIEKSWMEGECSVYVFKRQ